MFYNCRSFEGPVHFNTNSVEDMRYMFKNCSSLNKPVTFTNTSKINKTVFEGVPQTNNAIYLSRQPYLALTTNYDENIPVNSDNKHITDYLLHPDRVKEVSTFIDTPSGGKKTKKTKTKKTKTKKTKTKTKKTKTKRIRKHRK